MFLKRIDECKHYTLMECIGMQINCLSHSKAALPLWWKLSFTGHQTF